ncbi:MAG: hypothetical protein FWF81_04355 [Defluviitaleaceae bacterium]|nr:hypothetical protein [Defluviitaleaceae bacterium]
MAGKVRFPLEMADGILVGNLEELKKHFDIHKVVGHYLNGKLIQWLESRFYDDEAEAVAGLDKNAPDLVQRLAVIFGVTIEMDVDIDVSTVQTRNARIAELRQSTDDPDVVKNLDRIAFDQADLESLLDKGVTTVYLYSSDFAIPLEREDVTYIGIGNPVASFSAEEPVDFAAKGITFNNVEYCESYQELLASVHDESNEAIVYSGSFAAMYDGWVYYHAKVSKETTGSLGLALPSTVRTFESDEEKSGIFRSRFDGTMQEQVDNHIIAQNRCNTLFVDEKYLYYYENHSGTVDEDRKLHRGMLGCLLKRTHSPKSKISTPCLTGKGRGRESSGGRIVIVKDGWIYHDLSMLDDSDIRKNVLAKSSVDGTSTVVLAESNKTDLYNETLELDKGFYIIGEWLYFVSEMENFEDNDMECIDDCDNCENPCDDSQCTFIKFNRVNINDGSVSCIYKHAVNDSFGFFWCMDCIWLYFGKEGENISRVKIASDSKPQILGMPLPNEKVHEVRAYGGYVYYGVKCIVDGYEQEVDWYAYNIAKNKLYSKVFSGHAIDFTEGAVLVSRSVNRDSERELFVEKYSLDGHLLVKSQDTGTALQKMKNSFDSIASAKAENDDTHSAAIQEGDSFQMTITNVSMEYDNAEVFGQVLFGSVEVGDKLNFTLNNGEVRPVVVRGVTKFKGRERYRFDSDIKLVLSGLSKKSFKRGKSVSK